MQRGIVTWVCCVIVGIACCVELLSGIEVWNCYVGLL